MALTDIETIKKLIQSFKVTIPTILNERIKFELFEKAQLEYANVDDQSETVKIIRNGVPIAEAENPITLNTTQAFISTIKSIAWLKSWFNKAFHFFYYFK